MARGFESKAVADQQEEAQIPVGDSERPSLDPGLLAKRRQLELSRCDVVRRLSLATAEPHREMLRRALAALDTQIAALPVPSRDV
jgi:methionyl-tRNA formyltransferase